MSTLAWIVGRGLLGSCVVRALETHPWTPALAFPWDEPRKLRESIYYAVQGFRDQLLNERFDDWCIYWCAGKGVIGTSTDQLSAETATLQFFLDCVGNELDNFQPRVSGRFFLASSAGGVYAGSLQCPSTELTSPCPISPYGQAKLNQEQLLLEWARQRPNVSTLVGRLSNLYGPRQDNDKAQGLISHISRCLIFGVPVQIFVSLDTIRDYLFAEDAGKRIVANMCRLARESACGRQHVTKLYHSGKETTVAGVIHVFRQIAKRQLRVVLGLKPATSQQPLRLQFRSQIWCDYREHPGTELLDGVSRVHRSQLALFQSGRLLPPWLTITR